MVMVIIPLVSPVELRVLGGRRQLFGRATMETSVYGHGEGSDGVETLNSKYYYEVRKDQLTGCMSSLG